MKVVELEHCNLTTSEKRSEKVNP